MKIYDEIFEYISSLEIIDTHEHLPYCEQAREKNTDVLKEYLSHYFSCDLISAGLSNKDYKKVINIDIPLMDRWNIVEKYWEYARNTGYGRSLDHSVRILYSIDGISRSTLEELNILFLRSLEPGHFRKVFKEKSKIAVSILDSNLDCDREFFRSVYGIDVFIKPGNSASINGIEELSGVRIISFEDWMEACEKLLLRAMQKGAVGFKSGLAYQRSLKYERVSRNDAENDFNHMIKFKHQGCFAGENFQNYMMHFILHFLSRHNAVVQFHTGLQEGNGNIISNSDPTLLSNLFLEYPDVRFDIFHIAYPYQHTLSVLAKNFKNVYLDMCWAHIISPTASINTLVEWLDAVPVNKISAFGGDYLFIDGVAGHQYLARRNVAKALSIKVEEGDLSIERVCQIAQMIFYTNPVKLFDLSDITK